MIRSNQVLIELIVHRDPETLKDVPELGIEIVQLLEHVVLPLFQFLQELSRLAVGGLRGGSRRHGRILGRR